MASDRDPRMLPLVLTLVGALFIAWAAILSVLSDILRVALFNLAVILILLAWLWVHPRESRRTYERQVRAIKAELNHHPLPHVELHRVMSREYHERIEHWCKLRPGLRMSSGPFTKLVLIPNPAGIGYTPLEIWYRIDDDPNYKLFEHVPYRGILDGEPPVYYVLEVQSGDFHREHIGQVHLAFRYGHIHGCNCIYIARFFKAVGTLTWMIDRNSQRFYVNDPRLDEWYRALPPAQPPEVLADEPEGYDEHEEGEQHEEREGPDGPEKRDENEGENEDEAPGLPKEDQGEVGGPLEGI